jgi:hypothetical protein
VADRWNAAVQSEVGVTEPSASATVVRSTHRHAYCPLCGQPRTETLIKEVREPVDALCPGRCTIAWHVVEALRLRESASERVTARRKSEYENRQPHLAALSELLLRRWRTGDWTVPPERLLRHIKDGETASSGAHDGATCASSD